MDNKTFIARVSKQMGIEAKEASAIAAAFAQVLRDRVSKLDSIAIPQFGNFISVKIGEKVITDQSTGQRKLCPPEIKLEFVPSTMLKKTIEQ